MLKYVYKDGAVGAYVNRPLQPWEEPEEVQPTQEQIDAFLENRAREERERIRALRAERFSAETDALHWDALDLEKSGQDATQAWNDWIAAKQAIRESLPYPEES
jgi:hypothetical protein